MASFTETQTAPGFWDSHILDMLFPPAAPPSSQDRDLLRQFSYLPGLKELLMLRQVHALEHATVWMLSRELRRTEDSLSADNPQLSGISTDRGFYLYGQVALEDVARAAQMALRQITTGDWELAIHPRCGTNVSVGMLLTAGLTVGAMALLPRHPLVLLGGLGLAATTATYLTPELGTLAQRYITTAIPFNLAIVHVIPISDLIGRPAHFVQVRWVD